MRVVLPRRHWRSDLLQPRLGPLRDSTRRRAGGVPLLPERFRRARFANPRVRGPSRSPSRICKSRESLPAVRLGVFLMAKAGQKITLSTSRDIPFNKLSLSQSNVRRLKAGVSIEVLAED